MGAAQGKDRGLEWNALASFVARITIAVIGVICIPFYIHFLGIASYALVAFFSSLAMMSLVLDLGIGVTVNRELARHSGIGHAAAEMRDLVRTLELGSWGLSLIVGALLALASPFIATHWLHSTTLPKSTVSLALLTMGVLLAFQTQQSFYGDALNGLQQQVALSVVQVAFALIRSVGAVVILWIYSPTIEAFLIWQCASALGVVIAMAALLWHSLPKASTRPRVVIAPLRRYWRFAAATSSSNFAEALLFYVDKIILSYTLTLEYFGYYMVAWELANKLTALAVPIYAALFPRLSQMVGRGDRQAIKAAYHRGCQLLAMTVIPLAVTVAGFLPASFCCGPEAQ